MRASDVPRATEPSLSTALRLRLSRRRKSTRRHWPRASLRRMKAAVPTPAAGGLVLSHLLWEASCCLFSPPSWLPHGRRQSEQRRARAYCPVHPPPAAPELNHFVLAHAQNLLRYSRTWTSALAAWRATSAPTQRAYYPSPAVSQGSREISGPDHLVVQGRPAVFRLVRELSPVISTAAAGFHTSRLGGRAMGGVGRRDAVVVAPSSSSSPGENTPAWIHVSTVLGSGPLGEAKPIRF